MLIKSFEYAVINEKIFFYFDFFFSLIMVRFCLKKKKVKNKWHD